MNGEIVVDASLALKWVLEEPYTAEANDLLENWGSSEINFLLQHFSFARLPTLSRSGSSATN